MAKPPSPAGGTQAHARLAAALCDLVTQPGTDLLRVRVVNARPRLLCAVAMTARSRGVSVTDVGYTPRRGRGHVAVERLSFETAAGGACP